MTSNSLRHHIISETSTPFYTILSHVLGGNITPNQMPTICKRPNIGASIFHLLLSLWIHNSFVFRFHDPDCGKYRRKSYDIKRKRNEDIKPLGKYNKMKTRGRKMIPDKSAKHWHLRSFKAIVKVAWRDRLSQGNWVHQLLGKMGRLWSWRGIFLDIPLHPLIVFLFLIGGFLFVL